MHLKVSAVGWRAQCSAAPPLAVTGSICVHSLSSGRQEAVHRYDIQEVH